MNAPTPPRLVGKYRVDGTFGSGGMGVVLDTTDTTSGVRVALKLLHPNLVADRSRRQARLLREAHALAMLAHPNVVRVYEVGQSDQGLYVAMEPVEGTTLKGWLLAGQRTWPQVLQAFVAAGQGLAAAHAAGLVHRDFKSGNVLVGRDGRVLVTDFGLVRLAEMGQPVEGPLGIVLTRTGMVLGTPRYMAPEQHYARPVDGRTDQFGFCAALYEALYGHCPYAPSPSGSLPPPIAYALEVVAGRVHPPPVGVVPARIGAAITRGLSAEPEARFETMGALLTELNDAARGDARRRRTVAAAAGGAFAVLGLAMAIAAGWSAGIGPRDPCEIPAPQISATDERALEGRFYATSAGPKAARWQPFRTSLASYQVAMKSAAARACAPRKPDPEQVRCLTAAAGALKTLLDESARAHPLRTSAQLALLPAPEDCAGGAPAGTERLARAVLAFDGGDRPQGLAASAALARSATDAPAALTYGRMLEISGEPLQAILQYRRAGSLDATAVDPLLAEGLAQGRIGEHRAALATLDRALAVARSGGDAVGEVLLALAQAQRRLGQFEAALASADDAVAIFEEKLGVAHPAVALACHSRGWLAQLRGDHASALRDHERALAIWRGLGLSDHSRSGDALIGRAHAQLTANAAAEALVSLERAGAIRAQAPAVARAEVAYLRARAHADRDEHAEAKRAADEARALNDGAEPPDRALGGQISVLVSRL